MKIAMFTYYNEEELLGFHIRHALPYVDKIIVVEGDRRYDGTPYESSLIDMDLPINVDHYIVPLLEEPVDRWENEALQRRLAGEIAKEYDGMLFFGCVDEILHPAIYEQEYTEPTCLSLDNYYYYFNGKDIGDNPTHPMPIVMPIDQITDLHEQWEQRHGWPVIYPAGWHFSYLGGVERIKEKLSAYSHAEYDNDEVKDGLIANIRNGRDIFDRPDHHFKYVPIDDSFPKELVDNQDKYRDLIKA